MATRATAPAWTGAIVAAVLAATALVVGGASPGAARFADDGWSTAEPVVVAGAGRDAARLEVLPDGTLVALVLAAGSAYGHAGETVLVARTRTGDGWSDPEVVPLGTGDVWGQTFDTFADAEGRLLAVWAEKGASSGQWPVRSVARGTDGAWSVPEEVYVARTDGAYGDLNEVRQIVPRLTPDPDGGGVTVAWAYVEGMSNARITPEDGPFRARRWVEGSWQPVIVGDGYGNEAAGVAPVLDPTIGIIADPRQAVRRSDGRISYAFTLVKWRPVRTIEHALSDGWAGSPNQAGVWDGVPERPWDAESTTAWVTHLDPAAASWSAPALLVTTAGPLVNCASPDLPDNPPLQEFWQEWRTFSLDPGISTDCPGTYSRARSARYAPDGELRIGLEHRSSPVARVVLNQYLDRPCDDEDASPSYRFCFDKWDSTTWGVTWPEARIAVPPGAGRPSPDAVQEGAWPVTGSGIGLVTDAGPVTVLDRAGAEGKGIVFDRGTGPDVTWTPDPTAPGTVAVSDAFTDGEDVIAFYSYGSATEAARCGAVVLRAGADAVDAPLAGCLVGSGTHLRDVAQLPDGSLAWIDASASGAPVRLLRTADVVDPTTSTPVTPPESTPNGPTPPGAKPAPPAPAPFVNTAPAKVKGKARVGRVLKARPGAWQPAPAGIAYQWYAGKKALKKATGPRLKLTNKHVGRRISVRVTATAPGVPTATVTVKVGKVRR